MFGKLIHPAHPAIPVKAKATLFTCPQTKGNLFTVKEQFKPKLFCRKMVDNPTYEEVGFYNEAFTLGKNGRVMSKDFSCNECPAYRKASNFSTESSSGAPTSSSSEGPHLYSDPDSTEGYTIVNCQAYMEAAPTTSEGPNYAEIEDPHSISAYDIVNCPAYNVLPNISQKPAINDKNISAEC